MSRSITMDEPHEARRLDHTAQQIVGKPMDRPDGPAKVTGTATYALEHDVVEPLHGVLVGAANGFGPLPSIDLSPLERLPDIEAVIQDDRLLKRPAQGMAREAPAQGVDEVAHIGQPIAVVVGRTFEAARDAAREMTERLCHAASLTRAETGTADRSTSSVAVDPDAPETTTDWPESEQSSQGDLDRALENAAYRIEADYTTAGHTSAAMELHASIAEWHDGNLLLRGSYQMLDSNRDELADALGIDRERVRIVAPFVGGGFGGKLGISPEAVAAAIAAERLERPVSVAMSRQQVFEMTVRRSETRQRISLAADADGVLQGIGHDSLVSNLPGEDFSEPVAQATPFLYRGEHRRISLGLRRVHLPLAGSVRAPGECVGVTTLENAMDELAHAAGIDPVELRLRNIPDEDPTTGKPFSSRKLREALETGAERFGWDARHAEPGTLREGDWYIGLGMASATRVNMLVPSSARVRLSTDGRVAVETDMTDIGTGTYAILTQVASEMLGVRPERVQTRLGDTDYPPGSGSGGSFGAAASASSVYAACVAIRERLAARLDVGESEMSMKDGSVYVGNREHALTDLVDEDLEEVGSIEPGEAGDAVRQATFGAHFAEVAVNAISGEPRIRRMLGVFGVGRILNEKTARSQCYGGMIWGAGIALGEALHHDPATGRIVNRDLAEYHIPVNLDIPALDVVLLSERDDWANPLQVKGVGELGICGSAAAITNAIFNATGVRVRDYPATLDRIFPSLAAS